jgi:hypothetical protein
MPEGASEEAKLRQALLASVQEHLVGGWVCLACGWGVPYLAGVPFCPITGCGGGGASVCGGRQEGAEEGRARAA